MKNVINVVECAIEFENQFLIIERPAGVHASGLLSFVGGKVEEEDARIGEDILKNAIKREVFEEVGITITEQLSYVTTSYFTDSNSNATIIDTIFHVILTTKPKVVASPREVPKYFWMNYQEIINHSNSPEWLKRYISLIKCSHSLN